MDLRRLFGAVVSGDMSLLVSKFEKVEYKEKRELVFFAIQLNQINFLHYMLKHVKINVDELLVFSYQANQYDVAKYLITLGSWEKDNYLPYLLQSAVEKERKNWVMLFLEYKVICFPDLLKEIEKKWGEEKQFQLILQKKQVENLEFILYNLMKRENEDFEEYEKIYLYDILPLLFDIEKMKEV